MTTQGAPANGSSIPTTVARVGADVTVTTALALGPEVPGPATTQPPAAAKQNAPRPAVADAGDEPSVALAKEEVRQLLVQRSAVLRVPVDAPGRQAHARQVLADIDSGKPSVKVLNATADKARGVAFADAAQETSLVDTATRAYAPIARDEAIKRVRAQMNAVVNDPNFSGFADSDFEVHKYLGTVVKGDTAQVSLIGVEKVLRLPNPILPEPASWVTGDQKQYDVDLVRVDGHWRIAQVSSFPVDGSTGR